MSADLSNPPIWLDGVSRHYTSGGQTITAVSDVSLELAGGAVHALAGPSGSGKTTLINLMIDAEQPDEGRVHVRDDVAGGWEHMAFVPQGLGLMNELTIEENVALPLRLDASSNRSSHRDIDELLESLSISELAHRFPRDVSLGEQQRAALARAFVTNPRVVIADEPTAHQDEQRARSIMAMFAGLAAAGAAVLLATHEQRILDKADTVFMLENGQLISG